MTRGQRLITVTLGPLLALSLMGGLASRRPALAVVNESPSLPRGLYLRRPGAEPNRGAIVTVAQPKSVRSYLGRLGMPADVRLIKRVAATSGDAVCSDGRWLVAPWRIVEVRSHDRAGAGLPVWRGCRRLMPDERLLLGDTSASLDSRYFGPVTVAQIEGVYRETLTW